MNIIGLIGFAGSGKSTIARAIAAQHGDAELRYVGVNTTTETTSAQRI